MIFIQNKFYYLLLTGLIVIGLTGCSDDPASNLGEEEILSLLVANEGNFSDGNGSITSYDPENGQVVQEKFRQANGRPLAGIIQSMVKGGDKIFIVANNTNKIEVVRAESLESLGTITFENGITPSGFAMADETKGYVGDLFTNTVAVVDLENFEVTDTLIEAGNNPRGMVVVNNRLYVANSGFGDDNTVSVINTDTDEVISTLEVGAGPYRLVPDSQGRIWVVSNGKKAYDEDFNRDPDNDIPGRIDVIDVSTEQVVATVETGGFPKAITVDADLGLGWVVNEEAVQQIDLNSLEVIDEVFISRNFNGIGYSPVEGRLYMAHSRGFTQSGQAIIYDLEGAAVDSFQTGIAPMDFLFQVEEPR